MLRDFKRIMVYRNDFGGKIIVKITLPKTECESDINRLYDSISFSYFDSARDFIAKTGDSSVYTLSVEWQAKEKNKTIKIKRLSELALRERSLYSEIHYDFFIKNGLKLKR